MIGAEGRRCVHRVLAWNEYEVALQDKLREEVEEFLEDPCQEEMADIMEVLECLAEFYSIDLYDMETAKEVKAARRGSFRDRIFLEEIQDKEEV